MTDTLYTSTGTLHYGHSEKVGYKLVLEIDPGIVAFYRALIPKWIILNHQMYNPHISIVRKEEPNLIYWGKYEGEEVEFFYSPIIHHGEVYWWLNCFSKRFEEIRLELGLPVDSLYTRPPDGLKKTFHTTIGNTKTLAHEKI